jgi:hypothetical protein
VAKAVWGCGENNETVEHIFWSCFLYLYDLNGVVVSNADGSRVRILGKSWSFSEGLALD